MGSVTSSYGRFDADPDRVLAGGRALGLAGFASFALVSVALEHLVGFVDEPLCLGNAGPQIALTGLHLGGLAGPAFRAVSGCGHGA